MTPEEVLSTIEPFRSPLCEAMLRGWGELDRVLVESNSSPGNISQPRGALPPRRSPTARANYVNAWMWHHVEVALRPYGLHRVEERSQPYIALDSKLRIRLKKMTPAGVSSNILTRQQINLRKLGRPVRQPYLPLAEFGPTADDGTLYLEAGYVLDPAETNVERILLVCTGPDRWCEDLWVRGASAPASAAPATAAPATAAPPAAAALKPGAKAPKRSAKTESE